MSTWVVDADGVLGNCRKVVLLLILHRPQQTDSMVSYSNHAVVDNPLPLTVPFNVAEFAVKFVADTVVTVGAPEDFNVKMYPFPLT